MKSLVRFLLYASVLFLLAGRAESQEIGLAGAPGREVQNHNSAVAALGSSVGSRPGYSGGADERSRQLQAQIKKRIKALSEYLSLSADMISKAENEAIQASLKKLEAELKSLEGGMVSATPDSPA